MLVVQLGTGPGVAHGLLLLRLLAGVATPAELAQQGAIDAQIAKRFPLRDAGHALRYAEQGRLVGKALFEP
jgi:NADPH:quinone reductase-like Zn-dependent oxidoreductase